MLGSVFLQSALHQLQPRSTDSSHCWSLVFGLVADKTSFAAVRSLPCRALSSNECYTSRQSGSPRRPSQAQPLAGGAENTSIMAWPCMAQPDCIQAPVSPPLSLSVVDRLGTSYRVSVNAKTPYGSVVIVCRRESGRRGLGRSSGHWYLCRS